MHDALLHYITTYEGRSRFVGVTDGTRQDNAGEQSPTSDYDTTLAGSRDPNSCSWARGETGVAGGRRVRGEGVFRGSAASFWLEFPY